METTEQIYQEIAQYLDINYLIAFMAIAYLFKGVLMELIILIIKKDLYKDKLTKNIIIFIIGTLVALPFWYVFDHDKMKLFVTFCVGTSIHDLLIKTLGTLYTVAIKKITNKTE
jgi:hypothetical protein